MTRFERGLQGLARTLLGNVHHEAVEPVLEFRREVDKQHFCVNQPKGEDEPTQGERIRCSSKQKSYAVHTSAPAVTGRA